MSKTCYWVVGLLLLSSSLIANEIETIFQNALKLKEARLQEKYEVILNSTHPAVLKKIGGKERVLKLINKRQTKQNGTRLVDYQISRPSKVYRNEELIIAILEVHLKYEKQGKTHEGNSFLIAVMDKSLGKAETAEVKEKGKEEKKMMEGSPDKWYFVSGGGISNEESLKRLFPNLPEGISFPKKSQDKN